MSKLNVLLLANHLDFASGVTTYLKNLTSELVTQNDINLFLGCSSGTDISFFKEKGIKVLLIDELSFPKRSLIRFMGAISKIIKIIKSYKINIIHSNDHFVANIAKFASLPFRSTFCIQTIHGSIPPFGRLRVENADFYIFINETLQDTFIAKYPSKKNRTQLIYNGIVINQFYKSKEEAHEEFIFLCLSRLDKNKGIHNVIDAFDLMENKIRIRSKLIIVGDGDEIFFLKDKIKASSSKISLYDKTTNPKEYYRIADVFILASIEEGFGYTIVEASLSNCFVIVSNFKGSDQILRDNIDGYLYEKNSIYDLKDKMERAFIMRAEERNKYISNFNNRIQEHFNSKLMANHTVTVYRKVLTI
ncbi:MAG: glycosyltransferase family 4 protein [Ignavibacteria bacterium]|nr:glycosyltransferase family 4 protein [Ignavibacteria bacterium]